MFFPFLRFFGSITVSKFLTMKRKMTVQITKEITTMINTFSIRSFRIVDECFSRLDLLASCFFSSFSLNLLTSFNKGALFIRSNSENEFNLSTFTGSNVLLLGEKLYENRLPVFVFASEQLQLFWLIIRSSMISPIVSITSKKNMK